MSVLGLSQNHFKIGQQHNFKVFGDNLSGATVTGLTANVAGLVWTSISTTGSGKNHVNVKATLTTTMVIKTIVRTDTIGDLTVTVTDSGGTTTTTTFSPVTYQT